MADGYEDLREDELPGPAYEGYESAELACPAERSGHVAVSDGRHMFVWGGYKVSGSRRASASSYWSGAAGRAERASVAAPGASAPPRRDSAGWFVLLRVWESSHGSPHPSQGSWTVVTPAFCLQSLLPAPCPRLPSALLDVRALPAEGEAGDARSRNVFLFKGLGCKKGRCVRSLFICYRAS